MKYFLRALCAVCFFYEITNRHQLLEQRYITTLKIIVEYIGEFETLYGKKNMTLNLHFQPTLVSVGSQAAFNM